MTKAHPFPHRGPWGQRAVGESQCPSQKRERQPQGCPGSINPTRWVRPSTVSPQRCGSLEHCTDSLGDSLSWGMELIMGCWEEQSEVVQGDIRGRLPVNSLLVSTFVWPCPLPSPHRCVLSILCACVCLGLECSTLEFRPWARGTCVSVVPQLGR